MFSTNFGVGVLTLIASIWIFFFVQDARAYQQDPIINSIIIQTTDGDSISYAYSSAKIHSFNKSKPSNLLTVFFKETPPYLDTHNDIPIGEAVNVITRYAIDNDIQLIYKRVDSVSELIDKVEHTENSVGIGAVSINTERLKQVNFSLPYYITNTVLAYNSELTMKSIFESFCKVVIAFAPFLIAMLVISGILAYFGIPFFRALWLALVTSTTVGYGDEVPKTVSQKVVIGFWMLVSTYFLSLFTAVLAASLTNINSNYSPKDVGVVQHTEGHRICAAKRYRCTIYDNLDMMIDDVRNGSSLIDAAIHDKEVFEQYGFSVQFQTLANSMHSIIINKGYDEHKINEYIKF